MTAICKVDRSGGLVHWNRGRGGTKMSYNDLTLRSSVLIVDEVVSVETGGGKLAGPVEET